MKLLSAVQLFRGLCDRTRVRILNVMAQAGGLTATDLADLLERPRSTVARHLRYLYRCRLVTVEHKANEVFYALRTEDDPLHNDVVRLIRRRLIQIEGVEKDNRRLRVLITSRK